MMKKRIAMFMVMFMMLIMIPMRVSASGTVNESMKVGNTKSLSLKNAEKGASKGIWTSSEPSAVDIISSYSTSCVIKAVSMPSSNPVIIHCEYTYPLASGTYTYYATGYMDYYVTVSESGSSSDGSYTISASVSSMEINKVGEPKTITITSGTELSSDVYIKENSSSGSCVALHEGEVKGNSITYNVYPREIGKQNVEFQLIKKTGKNTTTIKARVKVNFNVTCSHIYNTGVVTKEPTETTEGVMTYTCKACGKKKTESIPKIRETEAPSIEETEVPEVRETEAPVIEETETPEVRETDISICEIIVEDKDSIVYDGKVKKPGIIVKNGDVVLTQGRDYTVSYRNNINAGTASVIIRGSGSYRGSVTEKFEISKAEQNITVDISNDTIECDDTARIRVRAVGSVTYISDNENIAVVDKKGVVTGVSAGTTNILVVAAENRNYKMAEKSITVTVSAAPDAENVSVIVSASNIELTAGESQVITISAEGDLPSKYTFTSSKKGTGYITSWQGKGENNTFQLKISGSRAGSGTVTISLLDTSSGKSKVMKKINIPVTVKSR